MHGMRMIAGSGRSGTTWVLDALAEANGLRPVFEPLHPAVSEIGKRYAYRALAVDQDYPDLERFLANVCEGRCHTWWTHYRRPADRLIPPLRWLSSKEAMMREYRRMLKFLREWPAMRAAARRPEPLVKCIRANLMLHWLSHRYDSKIVLLVRHPGAVIESQYRLRNGRLWDPEPVLRRYREDPLLHELTEGRYRKLLSRQLSPVEALALNWVIENQWAIERAADNRLTVVYYEQLKASPGPEWQRVCRALGLPNVPHASLIARPSQQSSASSVTSEVQTTGEPRWRRGLTAELLTLIQAVLDEVGFAGYHMSAAEPTRMPHTLTSGRRATVLA